MRVIVYVEGAGDKAAMNALLNPLLEQKKQVGVAIEFFESPAGDKKASVLTKVPRKAVDILLNDPHAMVVAMPDLYPKNKVFPHTTANELVSGILERFQEALRTKRNNTTSHGIKQRFRVFCFKHDLEALLLASRSALKNRLGVRTLGATWKIPVEDQDHDWPPKRVVEELFRKEQKRYRDTVDAPIILGASEYDEIAEQCPQCFKPFVDFLAGLGVPT